jgi:hypothetical protein
MQGFHDRSSRVRDAMVRHHANASLSILAGGVQCSVIYRRLTPQANPFDETATVPVHQVSACVAGIGALVEGAVVYLSTSEWPNGRPVRITTPVVLDAGGWAVFEVVPTTLAAQKQE